MGPASAGSCFLRSFFIVEKFKNSNNAKGLKKRLRQR